MRFRSQGRQRAFTLIEVLVVTAIVAIVVGLAVLKLTPSEAHRLEGATESLLRQLETARDEAVTRGRPLAFSSDGQGYQFWIADPARNGWLTLAEQGYLASGQFGAAIRLQTILINGTQRPLGERLVFPISGFSEVFVLTLATGSSTLNIQSDALGHMEIRRAP